MCYGRWIRTFNGQRTNEQIVQREQAETWFRTLFNKVQELLQIGHPEAGTVVWNGDELTHITTDQNVIVYHFQEIPGVV